MNSSRFILIQFFLNTLNKIIKLFKQEKEGKKINENEKIVYILIEISILLVHVLCMFTDTHSCALIHLTTSTYKTIIINV